MHQRKQRCILRRVVSVVLEHHFKYTLSALLHRGLAATARNAHAQACDYNKTAVVLEHHVKYALRVLLCLSHAAKQRSAHAQACNFDKKDSAGSRSAGRE